MASSNGWVFQHLNFHSLTTINKLFRNIHFLFLSSCPIFPLIVFRGYFVYKAFNGEYDENKFNYVIQVTIQITQPNCEMSPLIEDWFVKITYGGQLF